jgi:hypothetical protein
LQIRENKFGNRDIPIQKSDIVIIGGNNYRKGIFNGEFAIVNEVAEIPTVRTIRFYRKAASSQKSDKPVSQEVLLKWRSIELVFPDNDASNKIVYIQKGMVTELDIEKEYLPRLEKLRNE